MATEAQIKSNRENGRLGGPKTPEGKAVSRLNAQRHGIFASALAESDRVELRGLHEELAAHLAPVGPLEEMLVEKLALTYLRLERCARAEAHYQHYIWEEAEPGDESEAEPETQYRLQSYDSFEQAVKLFGRYDTTLTNQMLKLVREIERLQKARAERQKDSDQLPVTSASPCAALAKQGPGALRNEPSFAKATEGGPNSSSHALRNEPNPSQGVVEKEDTPWDAQRERAGGRTRAAEAPQRKSRL